MTTEERSSIENGVWLCATHSVLIDRDEATYTPDVLRRWKRDREAVVAAQFRGGVPRAAGHERVMELIAIGHEVVATGEIVGGSGREMSLRLSHFVRGDLSGLIRFGEEFESSKPADRFVLINAIGDGRTLAGSPRWKVTSEGVVVDLHVRDRFPRERAQDLGADIALGENGDLIYRDGDFALVSGVDAVPQKIRLCLWHQRGQPFYPAAFGSRMAEYHRLYRGTPWLDQLLKLEAVRLASIPYTEDRSGKEYTPFQCVESVRSVHVVERECKPDWIVSWIELNVLGLGPWASEVPLFVGSAKAAEPPSKAGVKP
jgi:hypothetical protein